MGNNKKYLLKRGKKKKILNAKLEHHMAGPNALLHEVSAYIYIYILITSLCIIRELNYSFIWGEVLLVRQSLSLPNKWEPVIVFLGAYIILFYIYTHTMDKI